MKRLTLAIFAAAIILVTTQYCSKSSGSGGGCSEPTMTVTSDPPANTVQPPAPGPTFPLTVNITSNMPGSGVTIEVKAHPEGSTNSFYTNSMSTTSPNNNNFTITGTPPATNCQVDITVTSKSCNTNRVTLSYKYSSK
jgi:hypothetical protein